MLFMMQLECPKLVAAEEELTRVKNSIVSSSIEPSLELCFSFGFVRFQVFS